MNGSIELMKEKVDGAFLRDDWKDVIFFAELGFEESKEKNDLESQIFFMGFQGAGHEFSQNIEVALLKYTWVISQAENLNYRTELTQNNRIINVIIHAFGHWGVCAEQVIDISLYEINNVYDAGFRWASRVQRQDFFSELYHAKSIALSRNFKDEAIIAAEEGIAYKRRYPYSPGCMIDHHLQIYAELLAGFNRGKEALDVISEAIEKTPFNNKLWRTRGIIYFRQGAFPEAVKDLTEYLYLENGTKNDYLYRGLAYSFLNKIPEAEEDFLKMNDLDKNYVYAALWLYGICRNDTLLSNFQESSEWPSIITLYYLGKIPEKALIESVVAETEKVQKQRLCEIYCFIALNYEYKGEINTAKRFYKMSKDTKAERYFEYEFSNLKLHELG